MGLGESRIETSQPGTEKIRSNRDQIEQGLEVERVSDQDRSCTKVQLEGGETVPLPSSESDWDVTP